MANLTPNKTTRAKALARLGIAAGALYMAPALIQLDQAHASGVISLANDPLTVQECGACHPAYAPRLLRSYAWQKIMGDLANHFGEDASVNEATRIKIEEYLVYNGSRPRKIGLRITDKKWFKKEHALRKVGTTAMEKAKSISNCTACHKSKPSTRKLHPK